LANTFVQLETIYGKHVENMFSYIREHAVFKRCW